MEGKTYVPDELAGQKILAVELPRRKRKALAECSCGSSRWVYLFTLNKYQEQGKKQGCVKCAYERRALHKVQRFSAGDIVGNFKVEEFAGRKYGALAYVVSDTSCGCLKTVLDSDHQQFNGRKRTCEHAIGRCKNTGGYVDWYWTMPGGKRVTVKEHRVVMEGLIGRELLSHEEVHHVNGVRDDNRPENLELWSHSQPPGQRVTDKVAWAKDILALYEPEALA